MFNALRLSIEVLAEVLAAEVLAVEVLAEVLMEILAELAVEIAGGTELEVLLIVVCYWNSLKSYTSFST